MRINPRSLALTAIIAASVVTTTALANVSDAAAPSSAKHTFAAHSSTGHPSFNWQHTAHPANIGDTRLADAIDRTRPRAAGKVSTDAPYTFVSMPDFLNQDLGDLSVLPTWKPGDPNTINDNVVRGMNTVMDDVASHNPSKVLVAGDLVQGHWGVDKDHTGLFGPVDTDRERSHAIHAAANLYFDHWQSLFDARQLQVLPALGDHEIGDNSWNGQGAHMVNKRTDVPVYKNAFADHFTSVSNIARFPVHPAGPAAGTAYAVMLTPQILLVTVDDFELTNSNVRTELDPQQAAWLDAVLAHAHAAGLWTIVQGHVPAVGPVRYRSSSHLEMAHGRQSSLWQILVKNKVNVYLCGEVHNNTAIMRDGVLQLSHGGLFFMAHTAYALATIDGDQMHIDLHIFHATRDGHQKMWGLDGRNGSASVEYPDHSTVIGQLTMSKDHHISQRTGILLPYRP